MIHVTQSVMNQITELFNKRKKAIHLEKYTVGEIFDHGGMSNIYRISDGEGNVDYVLRVSEEHKSPYSNDIFNVRELEILRELKKNSQPHVVQYLDAFVVDVPGYPRYYCAVMKILCTLNQYKVKGDGVEIAVRLGGDLLPLLQSFTDKSILHRDIKPGNIFYDADFRNETGFLLGDFGIAKRDTDTSVTPTGTESTMAPEVRGLDRALGSDRSRSDMYSLGVVMYRYLNEGIYPSNRERIDRMPPDTAPFPEPRFGSRRLKELVIKATSYYPTDRFDSPQEMLRELQKCEEFKTFIFHETSGSEDSGKDAEALQVEKQKLEGLLDQKKAELEDALESFTLKEQELQNELTDIKTQSSQREQELLAENELLKAKMTEREQELLTENESLKAKMTERERELLTENESLKAKMTERERELLAENESLKAKMTEREQELLAENESLKAKMTERERELLAENESLKAKMTERERELLAENESLKAEMTQREQSAKDDTIPNQSAASGQNASAGAEKTQSGKPSNITMTQPKKKAEKPLDLQIGDRLNYGTYPQGVNGELMPLIWRVLAVEENKALIISELLIDTMPYHSKSEAVTWEKSSLRQWLNSEFVFSAFGGRLPRRGVEYRNLNPDNPKYHTKGGAPTYDMIFLLSMDEMKKYFKDNNDRMAGLTEYAKKHGAWKSNEYFVSSGESAGLWWLRSPGYTDQTAARILINGDINSHGGNVTRDNVSIRPAMWIRLT